jgi:6-phosphogluconolactonase
MFGRNSDLHIDASVLIFNDARELAQGAAKFILSAILQALTMQDRFSLMLSGGSTPKAMYHLMGQPPVIDLVPWSKVHFFWGDERCVPPDHADSNYNMAFESLLAQLSLPPENIHRIHGEIPPEVAAPAYGREIAAFFGEEDNPPRFDLVLLGMGDDGHTASLFPDSPALKETKRWVVAVEHNGPPEPVVARVTITFPLINAARSVVMLVSGASKAGLVQRVLSGSEEIATLPVQCVNPEKGELIWLLDQAAAGKSRS